MLTIGLLLSLFLQAQAHADVEQLSASYLKDCGGKIYSKCDDEAGSKSQLTLFQAAVDEAIATKRKVFVVFGADWCAPCQLWHKALETNADLVAEFKKSYVMVELNSVLKSSIKLAAQLTLNIPGIPTALVYDPVAKANVEAFLPQHDRMTQQLRLLVDRKYSALSNGDSAGMLSDVRLSLLNSPVRMADGFGRTTFRISTNLKGAEREKLERTVASGLLYLESFHWIDAYRAFHMATEMEPGNAAVLALLAKAAIKLESYTANGFASGLIDEARKNGTVLLDSDDASFRDYTLKSLCIFRYDLCGDRSLVDASTKTMALEALKNHQYTKNDYTALLAFDAENIAPLEAVVKAEPLNSGAHHYLTHLYETSGLTALAAEHAEIYAKSAPRSPHAQHMYGHILPQIGKWEEALKQFQLAESLHQKEFAEEGVLPSEDWHFAHNRDLMSVTLIYLNRPAEAVKLLEGWCVKDAKRDCHALVLAELAAGKFREADAHIREGYATLLKQPFALNLLTFSSIGAKNVGELQAIYDDMIVEQSSMSIFPRLLISVLMDAKRDDLDKSIPLISTMVNRPGIENWEDTVREGRVTALLLRNANNESAAAKIDKLVNGLNVGGLCENRKPDTPNL